MTESLKQSATGERLDALPDDRIWHTYPLFDGKEHITEQREKCWCEPEVLFINDGAVINHRALQ